MKEELNVEALTPLFSAYPVVETPPEIVPAFSKRVWMDQTSDRFAYRCTPLAIANATGWELLCPVGLKARWKGGRDKTDIEILAENEEEQPLVDRFAHSHFGEGVLTFQPGYLFRTSAGWAVSVRGSPNQPSARIYPLEGLVETDWLPLTFTMNWRFTAPGVVHFRKGDPFCFLTLVPHILMSDVQPVVRDLDADPALKDSFEKWRDSRTSFIEEMEAENPATIQQGWQRNYTRGYNFAGEQPAFHLSKRRMKPPIKE